MTDLSGVEPWKIRPFVPGDAPAARRLVESVWHEHFHHHPDPFVRDFIYTRLSDVDSAQTSTATGPSFCVRLAKARSSAPAR